MPENKDHLKIIEKKITEMINKIQAGQAGVKTAQLVGFFIARGGLRSNTTTLQEILPKIVKILFDANEFPLCIEIMQEAIQSMPNDEKLKLRLKKIQNVANLNTIKPKVSTKKNNLEESSYDIASEIDHLDQMLKTKQSFHSNTNATEQNELSNLQTIVSPNFYRQSVEDSNERTLAPTTYINNIDADTTLVSGISADSNKPTPTSLKTSLPNLPSDIVASYPGLTLLSSRYEYIKILGEGGMGGVFLSTDIQLGRNVAIKFMNSQCISNPEISERFIREARTQALVNHPGIVSIYDVGTEGNPFIVMEYVEGKTIREIIKKEGGVSIKETVRLMTLIAEALDYAHNKKVIHRDVKPDNIILDQFGNTRLLDFGLAKQEQTPSMTISSQVMGTPYYMSPEQINAEEVGPPTDIYAWGVMFYQMVTGVVPFSKGDVLYHHVHSIPVAPNKLVMDIPDTINKIILKSMEKQISNRYQSFKEALIDLRTIYS